MDPVSHAELGIRKKIAEIVRELPVEMMNDGVDELVGCVRIVLSNERKALVSACQGIALQKRHC
jgi:hypothetical protein